MHRVVEVVPSFPFQSPGENVTDIGAGQPEFDVIPLVVYIFLGISQSAVGQQKPRTKLTLIIVRILLTAPKAAPSPGIPTILTISFVTPKLSMAIFNVETTPSRSLGRWDLDCIVKARGSWERAGRREDCEESPESS